MWGVGCLCGSEWESPASLGMLHRVGDSCHPKLKRSHEIIRSRCRILLLVLYFHHSWRNGALPHPPVLPTLFFNNVPKQTVLMFGHRELPRNYRCYSILLSKARLSASQTRKGLVLSVQTLMVVAWGFLESEFISKIIKEWGKC